MALQQFFTKSMSYKVMEPQLADVYAKNYTKAEMQDLLTFYNTPTGKKSLEVAPKIASESVALGEQVMISHKAELQKIIRESVEKSKPIKK
jgi:hypothetical protein